jgi:hypothetical protein
MTRPWRRMILHLLQIFLTLGLTFTADFSSMCLWPAPFSVRSAHRGVWGPSPHTILRATGKLTVVSDHGDPPRPYLYR